MDLRGTFRGAVLILALSLAGCGGDADPTAWTIDSDEDWHTATAEATGVQVRDGQVAPLDGTGTLRSIVRRFPTKRTLHSVVFETSPAWDNWDPVANVGPAELQDAPVLLCLGPQDYWLLGRRAGDGPGPDAGGYHAWRSRDMETWEHRGPVTKRFSRWVTTAEAVNGKAYIYYDYPNDQDPHVYVDDDLGDGVPGEDRGLAFADPTHGSDCAVIRDERGRFHVIYEDWTPINARQHSWDSPLAGHAISEDGLGDFRIVAPVVDHRTRPTGEKGTYRHPHWASHPDWDSNVAEYDIHEPEQPAYGDWAAIRVGTRYWLFCDVDPVDGGPMSVGRFTAEDLDGPFRWCGDVGEGHPDPDVGFAEGRFWLITQQKTDWVSPGPWVERVEAQAGVDTDGDGTIDRWTGWREVKETYAHTPAFAKHVAKTPAALDPVDLPAGFGFAFEVRMTDTTANASRPSLDRVTLHLGR